MTSYIKITKEMSELVNQLNYSMSEIEVKGESVKHLFNSRMLIKQLLENTFSEEDIVKEFNKKEEKD